MNGPIVKRRLKTELWLRNQQERAFQKLGSNKNK